MTNSDPLKLPATITAHPNAFYPLPDSSVEAGHGKSPVSTEEWKELVATLKLHRRRLLRIPGVTAVDIGYKLKEETRTYLNELALRVHVERKLPKDTFKDRPHDLIDPEKFRSPSGGVVKMDVIEADYRLVQIGPGVVREMPRERGKVNRLRRVDPLVGGVSIGSPMAPAGTLGALVWDRQDGSICLLSNWHVLAGDMRAEVGAPCFQPGLFDQGRSTDVVAHLKRWSFTCKTDAAIAELNGSRRYSTGEILDMFQTIKDVAPYPHLGMIVHKSGRSSGHSWGFIDGLYFSSVIQYSNGIVRVFEDQLHIAPLRGEPISEPGDSGSVWVTNAPDEGYLAVGLHFAGDLPHSSFGEYALANPMSVVMDGLGFSFRPLFFEIRDEDVRSMSAPRPPAPQPVRIQLGNGAEPMSIVLGGLGGSGGQPVDDRMGPGGTG